MKIDPDLIQAISKDDPETNFFLRHFDENQGLKILEVGSHDSPIASTLAKLGHQVTGVDLRECDQESHANYKHITCDFCNLPNDFMIQNMGTFDCAIAVSSIEHFGLGTYLEENNKLYYDVVACRNIYNLLKPNGAFYIVVPFGGKYVEKLPDWRVYDFCSFRERIVQDFLLEKIELQVSEKIFILQREYMPNEPIDMFMALFNTTGLPNVSILAKLRKG